MILSIKSHIFWIIIIKCAEKVLSSFIIPDYALKLSNTNIEYDVKLLSHLIFLDNRFKLINNDSQIIYNDTILINNLITMDFCFETNNNASDIIVLNN